MSGTIDLHTHTTASDGTVRPARLVEMAQALGLAALAITDHDTLAGVVEAQQRAAELGIELIPGIELTTYRQGLGSLHILGYWPQFDHPELTAELAELQKERRERNKQMIARLAKINILLDENHLQQLAAGGMLGRPHFAQAMVELGYVRSEQAAFDHYIGDGKPAYVQRKRLTPERAIELIHQAGGVAVLAHPGLSKAGPDEIQRQTQAGLDGLESLHPNHTQSQVVKLSSLAHRLGLVLTGGSDFHGRHRPNKPLGSPAIPKEYLDILRNKKEERNS